MQFKEETIKTFSGLSTETKPTSAGGSDVPNGSRWREVDTNKEYFYNLSDDTWYDFSFSVESSLIGSVCTDNSTTTALGIDEVFTGDWQDTLEYGTVVIGIIADQDSATDGLEIQWSADGSNIAQDDVFTISANTGKVYRKN